MPALRGAVTILVLLVNLAFWASLVIPAGFTKLVTRGRWRRGVTMAAAHLAEAWVAMNDRIFDWMLPTTWEIRGIEGTRYDGRYLIISNHVSWVDIFAILRAFHGHTAFIRFFLKSQLLWAPFVGQASWALDFPFMRRYPPEYLAKHPEKRGTDLATTRKALRRYRRIPVAILNFVEGTRFSRDKHADEDSPYRFLLRPRLGGIAFVLASMGEQLDAMFDVTLAYPGGDVTMWDFVTGRVPHVVVEARRLDVPPQFFDAGITEPGPDRDRFKEWIEGLWREKDARLAALGSPEY
jgi:1-acyl-sn-glycerol-3-phosphate acyltransferase